MSFKKPRALTAVVVLALLAFLVAIFVTGMPKGSDTNPKTDLSSQVKLVYSTRDLLDQLADVASEASTETNPVIRDIASDLEELKSSEEKVLAEWMKNNAPAASESGKGGEFDFLAPRGLIKNLEASPSDQFRQALSAYFASISSTLATFSPSGYDSELAASLERISKKVDIIRRSFE